MTLTPDAGYISDSARTEGQGKQFLEDLLALIKEAPGGSSETELTLDGGTITPEGATHNVDTEADTSNDDLTHMVTTHHPEGRWVLLRANDADRTVTVKNGSGGVGQFFLAGGADINLSADAYLWLVQRGGNWHQVELAGVGSGGAFTPKGTWSAIVTYDQSDFVQHDGDVFISKVNSNLNNEPDAVTPGDTTEWMWVPTIQGADGTPINLDDLLDVGASDPEHGDILRYDSDLEQWIKYNSQVWEPVAVVSGVATLDISNKDKFLLTVDADCELGLPTNAVPGAPFVLRIVMSGTHAFSFDTDVFKGTPPAVLINDGDETILSGIILDVVEDPYSATAIVNLVKQIQA